MGSVNSDNTRHSFPLQTWLGLVILIGGQILLQLNVHFVAVWLTPIMWTGYILAVDGWVFRLRGRSWLTTNRREFPFMALISIGVWLVFEAYNFHLINWLYGGVPHSPWIRNLAYFWSFATIMPGVFETIDLISSLVDHLKIPARRSRPISVGPQGLWFISGLGMISIPLTLPTETAAYLFGPVWIGFILVFDPINQAMGLPSFRLSLQQGRLKQIAIILMAGLLCGVIWETWNYQALLAGGGHWIYTVPQALRIFDLHYGQMPVLGLLGFPPFALELVIIYSFIRRVVSLDRYLPQPAQSEHPLLARILIEDQ